MATMRFDLVSPEKNMASGDASVVVIPGIEGDLGALPGHAPFVTTLRPGVVAATIDGVEKKFVVFGGFAEISPEAVTVLADDVGAIDDLFESALSDRIAEAEGALGKDGDSDTVSRRAQYLSDLRTLKDLRPA